MCPLPTAVAQRQLAGTPQVACTAGWIQFLVARHHTLPASIGPAPHCPCKLNGLDEKFSPARSGRRSSPTRSRGAAMGLQQQQPSPTGSPVSHHRVRQTKIRTTELLLLSLAIAALTWLPRQGPSASPDGVAFSQRGRLRPARRRSAGPKLRPLTPATPLPPFLPAPPPLHAGTRSTAGSCSCAWRRGWRRSGPPSCHVPCGRHLWWQHLPPLTATNWSRPCARGGG